MTMHDYSKLDPALPLDAEDDRANYVAVFGEAVVAQRPFMNIGAGDWTHPLWRNMDYVQPPYDQYTPPDYNIDLSAMPDWPIESGSMQLLFTSHTLEHINDPMVEKVLAESYRVLAPGGILRIVVPDITTAYYAYLLKDFSYFDYRSSVRGKGNAVMIHSTAGHTKGKTTNTMFFQRFASCFGNLKLWEGEKIDPVVERTFAEMGVEAACAHFLKSADFSKKKPFQHINYYTGERLQRMVTAAGFQHAVRTSYGQSLSPLLRNRFYFDRTRPNESLYVDAIKV